MKASGYARVSHDWYQEDRQCVDALLDVEPLHGECWDPSCGGGNIPMALNARGLRCFGSDIAIRGYGFQACDFFTTPITAPNIISNPPYGVIEPYIRRALEKTTGKVCILARLAFLESARREAFFREVPLARVWVSRRRLSMPPGGSGIKATGGTVAYAWFVFEHGHTGPATVGWV